MIFCYYHNFKLMSTKKLLLSFSIFLVEKNIIKSVEFFSKFTALHKKTMQKKFDIVLLVCIIAFKLSSCSTR